MSEELKLPPATCLGVDASHGSTVYGYTAEQVRQIVKADRLADPSIGTEQGMRNYAKGYARGKKTAEARFAKLEADRASRPEAESEMSAELTNERIIEIADKTRTAESRDGDYILPISFARAIAAELKVAGNAARDESVVFDQVELMRLVREFAEVVYGQRHTIEDTSKNLVEYVKSLAGAATNTGFEQANNTRDAERYRWLQRESERDYIEFHDTWYECKEALDEAIDAAIKASKQGGGNAD